MSDVGLRDFWRFLWMRLPILRDGLIRGNGVSFAAAAPDQNR
jgi:hypothetical protein